MIEATANGLRCNLMLFRSYYARRMKHLESLWIRVDRSISVSKEKLGHSCSYLPAHRSLRLLLCGLSYLGIDGHQRQPNAKCATNANFTDNVDLPA